MISFIQSRVHFSFEMLKLTRNSNIAELKIFNDERVKSLMQAPVSPRKAPEIQLEDIPPLDIVIPPERVITIPQEQIDAAKREKEKGNQGKRVQAKLFVMHRSDSITELLKLFRRENEINPRIQHTKTGSSKLPWNATKLHQTLTRPMFSFSPTKPPFMLN